MRLVAAFCVGDVDDGAVQPAEQIDALFAVCNPVGIPIDSWTIEDCLAASEIESVRFDVATGLRFIPSWHYLIVTTNKRIVYGHSLAVCAAWTHRRLCCKTKFQIEKRADTSMDSARIEVSFHRN